MKFGSPKLFYLYRRGFVFFLLLTGINSFCHNTSAFPIDYSIDNITEPTVHISTGTFVYNSERTEKTKSKKDYTKKNKIVPKRKKSKVKITSSVKKASDPFSRYHYTTRDNEDFFRSIALQKTLFTYTNNHIKKRLELIEFWCESKTILSYKLDNYGIRITHSIRSYFQNYQVRPPPYQ